LTINGFDGAINGIKSLINWKKPHSPNAIRLQPRSTAISIDGIKRQNH